MRHDRVKRTPCSNHDQTQLAYTRPQDGLIGDDRNTIVFHNTFHPGSDVYLTHVFTLESGVVNVANFNVDDLRDQARAETIRIARSTSGSRR